MFAAHIGLAAGAGGGAYGIYSSLTADHLWAASLISQPSGNTQFDPIRGSVVLQPGTVPGGNPTIAAVSGMNNRLGAAMTSGLTGFYASIGAIGTAYTILVAYNTLTPGTPGGDSYYGIIATGGATFSTPASARVRRNAGNLIFEDSVDASPSSTFAIPAAASPYPALMLFTQDGTNLTRRVNQLTKTTVAHGDGTSFSTANTFHTHGYTEPTGNGRCSGDHFMEAAIWKRVLSDAEATSLLQDRASYFGITLGA